MSAWNRPVRSWRSIEREREIKRRTHVIIRSGSGFSGSVVVASVNHVAADLVRSLESTAKNFKMDIKGVDNLRNTTHITLVYKLQIRSKCSFTVFDLFYEYPAQTWTESSPEWENGFTSARSLPCLKHSEIPGGEEKGKNMKWFKSCDARYSLLTLRSHSFLTRVSSIRWKSPESVNAGSQLTRVWGEQHSYSHRTLTTHFLPAMPWKYFNVLSHTRSPSAPTQNR